MSSYLTFASVGTEIEAVCYFLQRTEGASISALSVVLIFSSRINTNFRNFFFAWSLSARVKTALNKFKHQPVLILHQWAELPGTVLNQKPAQSTVFTTSGAGIDARRNARHIKYMEFMHKMRDVKVVQTK